MDPGGQQLSPDLEEDRQGYRAAPAADAQEPFPYKVVEVSYQNKPGA